MNKFSNYHPLPSIHYTIKNETIRLPLLYKHHQQRSDVIHPTSCQLIKVFIPQILSLSATLEEYWGFIPGEKQITLYSLLI